MINDFESMREVVYYKKPLHRAIQDHDTPLLERLLNLNDSKPEESNISKQPNALFDLDTAKQRKNQQKDVNDRASHIFKDVDAKALKHLLNYGLNMVETGELNMSNKFDLFKVDVDEVDSSERHTPIMMLTMGLGRLEMAAMLLRHHVDLSLKDRQGNTAVMLAVSHRNSKMLKVSMANMAHLTAWIH